MILVRWGTDSGIPNPEKLSRSNDVYFNEAKYHSKPDRVEEIRRVVFQEDGPDRARQVVAEPPILRRSECIS